MLKQFFSISILSMLIFYASCTSSYIIETDIPTRESRQKDVIELRCEPVDTVRVAFIGLGNRGIGAIQRFLHLPTASISVLCDVDSSYVSRAHNFLSTNHYPNVQNIQICYGAEDWKRICQLDNIDLIYVCTHWELHAPIAIEAMKNGKHVAIEVPIALTLEECWDIVNTAEQTQRHCMMLENCNYDFFEMAILNMVQQGLLGEIVHAEGAYIHDLRALNFDSAYYWKQWRLKANTSQIGNLYPTHGLGPIAHAMNIHRGDKMNTLVSMASDQFGMTAYAKTKFGENSDYAKTQYLHGDISTSIIRTEKGKTIMIQHDVTSPRPYSRHHLISGTKGFVQKYPIEGLAFDPDAHNFISEHLKDSLLSTYEHPIVKEIGDVAKKVGGHGGMDFIMDYRLIYCLNHGLPLDQDVYDAVEWSCLVPLTKLSIENNSAPVQIPDFTRGAWKKVKTVTYFTK